MYKNQLLEQSGTPPASEGKGNKTNRWLRRTFLVVAMLLLTTVITSIWLNLPGYTESNKSMVIAEAMLFFTLSTVLGEAKSK